MKIIDFKNKFFILIFISFALLMFSLYLSYSNISANNNMIEYIEKNQTKLSYLSNKLNYDIKTNQTDLLQFIALNKPINKDAINRSFEQLNTIALELDEFSKKNTLIELNEVIRIIKIRVRAYILVKNSLLSAIESKDTEDINDAIIGFNMVTIKFSEDIDKLLTAANSNLSSNMMMLKQKNDESSEVLIFSFLIAIILISFSVYKINLLNQKIVTELERAESAEIMQQKLQLQLLKYNEDLEHEITKKTKELQLKIYSHFLSGLPNRNKLLADAEIYNFNQLALLNIDKFQKFNDVYGEEIGNIALKLSAEFLRNEVKDDENILIYHINGDEFVFAVKDTEKMDNTLFTQIIENVLIAFSKEIFAYEDKTFHFVMSAGISFSGRKKMLAYADMALKDAKRRNVQLSIFSESKDLEKTHQDDIECHKKLITAFKTDSLISFYQPVVPIQDSDKEIRYESLARLREEDGNIIPPFNFIRVARLNRIYYKITKQMVKNTFNVVEKYKVPCSINISVLDIENPRTVNLLYEYFENFKYSYLITVELLETEEFKDYQVVYDFCVKMRSYGVKIALDDFGSGYSNFTHILNLPVDFIKIDSSLISNIDRDLNAQIMVETIVSLAKKLNVETIAEYVSSKEILNIIKKLDVDYAQGFYAGKPETIETHLPYFL